MWCHKQVLLALHSNSLLCTHLPTAYDHTCLLVCAHTLYTAYSKNTMLLRTFTNITHYTPTHHTSPHSTTHTHTLSHHRESIAFFLTRGELWISWEHGRKVFEELMLDFENSVSSGCWMKSSGSAFINSTMEYYCPVTYGVEIDPTGKYIRTYIPELKDFPSELIYIYITCILYMYIL